MSIDHLLEKLMVPGVCEKETHYNRTYDGITYCTLDDDRYPCKYQCPQKEFVFTDNKHGDYLQQCKNPRYKK